MLKRLIVCMPLLIDCTSQGTAGTTLDQNKTLSNRALQELFNERRPEAASTYVADDFISHNPQIAPGPAGIEAFVRGFIDGFAEFRGDTEMVVAEGDRVMTWLHWTGKHTGTFAGVPATGKRVRFDTIEIFRIRDGKIVEHWDIADRLTLQTELGLIQPGR